MDVDEYHRLMCKKKIHGSHDGFVKIDFLTPMSNFLCTYIIMTGVQVPVDVAEGGDSILSRSATRHYACVLPGLVLKCSEC